MGMISEKKELDMQSNNKPFVAIYMITYNHESYIAQAVESIMMQQANFEYKLFIGEDCSTDGTREICTNLKEKHPNKIDLSLNAKNLGATLNAQQIYKACFESGAKYIAMLEGDDYWTDPLKLQKQVDFLEENEDFSMCFTSRQVFLEKSNVFNDELLSNEIFTTESILRGVVPFTQTMVFRNIHNFRSEFQKYGNQYAGDRLISYIMSLSGKIGVLPDITAVYRFSEKGVWSSKDQNDLTFDNLDSLQQFYRGIGLPIDNFYFYEVLYQIHLRTLFGKAPDKVKIKTLLKIRNNYSVKNSNYIKFFGKYISDLTSILLEKIKNKIHS
ncbi:MAG: glycosyltransferase [Bacteroidota bacterium]